MELPLIQLGVNPLYFYHVLIKVVDMAALDKAAACSYR